MTRREMMRDMGLAAGAVAAFGLQSSAQEQSADIGSVQQYELPPLPYEYGALAPHIDEETLRIHHDKHHAAYVTNLNKALQKLQQARQENNTDLANYWWLQAAFNGSGHVMHVLYWNSMKPDGGGQPEGSLAQMIQRDFGSIETFNNEFKATARDVRGNGWGMLALEPLGRRLVICGIEKHENVSVIGAIPLMVVDVWEHAYYLKYQNKRPDYISAWMENLVDWHSTGRRLDAALRCVGH